MFEIEKWYRVWLVEGGEEGSMVYKVADYQAPLLRLHNKNIGEDMIVNTSSPMFVRAQKSEHQDLDQPLSWPIGVLNEAPSED